MPLVSVIVPIRNEEKFIAQCLDSILPQARKRDDIEILCVDGASTDSSREIIVRCAGRESCVRLIDNPDGIVPCAMNRGIEQAKGQVIIRLDCHAEYPPNYIEKCLEVLERTGADNVGGYVTTRPGGDTSVGEAIAAATSSRFGVGGSVFRTGGGEQQVDTVPFGCFRRDVFERVGMYDERLVRNQDIELNSRIRAAGGSVVISPEINLTYYNRSTLAGLRRQAFHNGLWNPYTIWIVGSGLKFRHFVPLVFVLSLLSLAVGGLSWPICWCLLGLESLVYLTVGLAMASKTKRRAGVSVFLVMLVFVQLHLSYGVGSLCGVVTAPLRFGLLRRGGPGKAEPE